MSVRWRQACVLTRTRGRTTAPFILSFLLPRATLRPWCPKASSQDQKGNGTFAHGGSRRTTPEEPHVSKPILGSLTWGAYVLTRRSPPGWSKGTRREYGWGRRPGRSGPFRLFPSPGSAADGSGGDGVECSQRTQSSASSSTPSSPSTPPQPPVVRSRIFHSYTLKKLLEEFSIPFTDDRLHVAGNDAHFTLRALLMIAVCDVRRELDEAPVWVWVPVLEAVARAPLPPDATQAWAEGGYEEKREESGCY
ncbi:hypothetical protein S7711_08098 [Stachybotrys chartarum IBT 7711]|uniref:Uncharacterized protein n=1 Tax=Stachybotrys chartarum (strain CBS 109288 / IBT 7711) TaxID=1280523 RepID=A0A084B253_STACB|nr:hypothetical protein S7711_08098 [Stachybotrys chartarum IBT 7711]KFA51818.1 hypothetical protein S40293_05888 [Stachybotrys chartarum IBT 40293]